MPEIRLRHVVSCSSQDSTHCAENLLKADTYRKWRAAKAGERTISVVLQLEKEEQIHSVDIGNDGSAFVEVLVGSSAAGTGEQDYEVLLVTSSFMSPSESRSGSNPTRVRFFGPDKLVRGAAEKRWDRVKIVCSQPYSKDSPYGLSFVRFHSPPDKDEPEASPQKVTKLGQFRVKEEDEGASSLRPGALFFSRINKTSTATASDPAGPSYAAATLQASSAASSSSPASRAVGSTSKPQESPKGKRKLDLNQEERKTPSKPTAQPSPPTRKRSKLPAPTSTPATTSAPAPARGAAPGKLRGEGTEHRGPRAGPQELGKILKDVVVVLSGFQNPFRSELRDKALELGAKYRPDWTADSTHLICAFANTPKYSQVLGLGGRIVRKEWVLDCHRMRRRLPSRRYLMAGPDSSSEDEGDPHSGSSGDEAPKLPRKRPQTKTKPPQAAGSSSPQRPPTPGEGKPTSPGSQEDIHFEGECSEGQDNGAEDSGDTEDELRRVAEQKEQRQPPHQGENGQDPYAGSTDENTDNEGPPESPSLPVPELPDFFQGKHFFLYGEFPGDERRKLSRYVTAFNGELEDYMSDRVQFVITAQEWDPSFEEALMDNPSLVFVRPRWIYSCNEKQKLLPHQLYGVVPQA
ncbi:X-ray repair cross complementing 1 [Phyllostomus discolor]|uniref:DNA repair protein XRCC1 n=1 Tax=Phyllostomus discolor TaxID=89673 RepID=A0A6J2N0U2_9CHIR|nr:DNA repair protein XRCC1 isoform X2 [Phyllostomus discolor]KAF6079967.1 X-ray repair cross complementing 1 [Phyllostomus discolor]